MQAAVPLSAGAQPARRAAGSLPLTRSRAGIATATRGPGAGRPGGQRQRRAGSGGGGGGARPRSTRMAASSQQPALLEVEPALVLAGFPLHELAAVRALMDQAGGQDVRVVPTTPAMLHAPTAEALRQPEPLWDQPVPPDWVDGGGWGQQRMVLIAGLEPEAGPALMELFEAAGVPTVVPALATQANAAAPLGEALGAALRDWRQAGGGQAAAAAAQPPPVQFVEDLPPPEAVVSPAAAPAASGASSSVSSQRARQVAASAPPEVVQAEFSERPSGAAGGKAEAGQDGAATPLDVIDAIATGEPPRAPPLSAATASAASSSGGGGGGPEDSLDSEQLLAAARAALGLDSAEMQRLVDEAAARAAAEAGIPFVGADGTVVAASEAAPRPTPPRPRPAAAAGSSSRPRPWETPSSSSGGSSSGGSGGSSGSPATAAEARPSKGFGSVARPPSRKAAKAAAKAATKHSSQEVLQYGGSGVTAARPAAAPTRRPAKRATPPQPQPAPAPAAAAEGGADEAGSAGEAGDAGGATLPPVDQFVLSASQLREVTERHGLDYEELLAGLAQRGIKLVD